MTLPVLIVEDDEVTTAMLTSALRSWGYHPVSANTAEAARELLRNDLSIRFVILDWGLPGMSGVNLCSTIRDNSSGSCTYIILLTARDAIENQFKAFESGADDLLTKPYHPNELRLRLRVGARILRIQDQLEQSLRSPERRLCLDKLTGIANRDAILKTLSKELDRRKRQSFPVSVLAIDVDNFKQVNEAMGSQAGDFVLREIGDRMATTLRTNDAFGRIGGDQFLVVLPHTSKEQAFEAANRLHLRICAKLYQMDDRSIQVACSIGIATSDPDLCLSNLSILAQAEDAVYLAKRAGGDQIRFWTDKLIGEGLSMVSVPSADLSCGAEAFPVSVAPSSETRRN